MSKSINLDESNFCLGSLEIKNYEETRRKLRYSIKTTVLIAFKNFVENAGGIINVGGHFLRRFSRATLIFPHFLRRDLYFSDRAIIAFGNNGSRNPSIISSTRRYNVNLRDLNYFRLQRGPVIVLVGLSNIPPPLSSFSAHVCTWYLIYHFSHVRNRYTRRRVGSIMK